MRLEICYSHEESTIILVGETNSCGFSGIVCPEDICVCIRSSPFALSPRVANLQDLSSIVEDVGSDECVGVSTNYAVGVN